MSEIKYMDIAEFRREGYLQELNRNYLHPLGLALQVTVADDGTEHISGVWDCRDDPEGVRYDCEIDLEKVERVKQRWHNARLVRLPALGYMVQPPIPPTDRSSDE